MADERLVLEQTLAGGRDREHDIVMIGKPPDEHLEGREQGGKKRAAVLGAGLFHSVIQSRIDGFSVSGASKGLPHRTGAVAWQLRVSGDALETPEPELFRPSPIGRFRQKIDGIPPE